jgi:hypothetical protein
MKRVGFQFDETMTGTWTRVGSPGDTGSFRVQLRVKAEDALRHLRDHLADLEGTLDMEGFADDVPVRGKIEIAPLVKRIIRYELDFTGNDGKPYRFAGQKNIRFSDLVTTMTTLDASVTDAGGTEVARATIRFDLKADLLPFLISWKPAVA